MYRICGRSWRASKLFEFLLTIGKHTMHNKDGAERGLNFYLSFEEPGKRTLDTICGCRNPCISTFHSSNDYGACMSLIRKPLKDNILRILQSRE